MDVGSVRRGALDTLLRLLSAIVLAWACVALLSGYGSASGWLFLASAGLSAWPALSLPDLQAPVFLLSYHPRRGHEPFRPGPVCR